MFVGEKFVAEMIVQNPFTYLVSILFKIYAFSIPTTLHVYLQLFETVLKIFFCDLLHNTWQLFFQAASTQNLIIFNANLTLTDKSHMVPGQANKAEGLTLRYYTWLETHFRNRFCIHFLHDKIVMCT